MSADALPMLALLRQAVDALDEGVVTLGDDRRISFMNATALRVLNLRAEDVIGQDMLDLPWEIRDAEGRPLRRADHPALLTLADGEPRLGHFLGVETPTLEAESLWVDASAWPIRADDGRVIGSVSAFRDVTHRREAMRARRELQLSEARLRAVLDTIEVGVFQADATGRCETVNEGWTRITGMTLDEALGDGWSKAVHPDDRERVWQEWNAAVRASQAFRSEYRFLRPDGVVRWVTGTARALPARDGASAGYIGSVTDITVAKEAALLKDQLIGTVSHELREPLVAMVGALEYMDPENSGMDAHTARLRDMALRNGRLLTRLTTSLMDLERAREGHLPVRRRRVPVTEVKADVDDLIDGLTGDVTVHMAFPADVENARVRGDRDRILQVFMNLITNAARHSPREGVVEVGGIARDADIEFFVRDQGPGIPAAMHDKVFEPFTHVQPSGEGLTADPPLGAGLGLSIVRALVERHEGRVWVDPDAVEGATLRFTIPRWPDD